MVERRSKCDIERRMREDVQYRNEVQAIQTEIEKGRIFCGEIKHDSANDGVINAWVTVGMAQSGLPELVMCGVPEPYVDQIVGIFSTPTRENARFLSGQCERDLLGYRAIAVPVSGYATDDVLGYCYDLAAMNGIESVSVVQIVFANECGQYPWHREYDEQDRKAQPIIGFSCTMVQ